jgi:hypothetical protein
MEFLRRHLFFILALIPFGYLASIDLESTQSNPRHRWAVVLGFVFMGIYVVQRMLLVRKKWREQKAKELQP